MPKITKRFVDTITPDSTKPVIFWDTELKGFGVVVLPSGRRTYCVQYRNQDRVKRRLKIGVHGAITTEEARTRAKTYLMRVFQGKDPLGERNQRQEIPTLVSLWTAYRERHGSSKRPKSLSEDKKLFDNIILPAFGDKKIITIDRTQVEKLHLKLKETPYQANRALSLLSSMFSRALYWGWISKNPVQGIARYPEPKRERWLSPEEVSRLWKVLDAYPTSFSAYVCKLLLLTGARKGETLKARWDHFDLEKGIWTKPSHLTKQKKTERLPLSKQAVAVLREIEDLNEFSSLYVFPGRIKGEHLTDIKKFWKTVIQKADLTNVRIHDLRHTHASHLVSKGLSLSVVGRLLGHTQASTTQRYAHLADEPLREAAELFGSQLDAMKGKKKGSD